MSSRLSFDIAIVFRWMIVLHFMTLIFSGRAEEAQPEPLPVVCRAIEVDECARSIILFEVRRPVELVVVGTAKAIRRPEGGRNIYEVSVEKVLYGHVKGKSVRFQGGSDWGVMNSRKIFALIPSLYATEEPYLFKYSLGSDEVASQTALSGARLDVHALSSCCIFVGRDLESRPEYLHTVEVIEGLYGPVPANGKKLTVKIDGYSRHANARPAVRGKEQIYFIRSVYLDRELKENIYHVRCRYFAEKKAEVREALKRRALYPIVTDTRWETPEKVREVIHRGGAGDAIKLLGSSSKAAVTLGHRTLVIKGGGFKRELISFLGKELFDPEAASKVHKRRLENAIRTLTVMGEAKFGAEIGRFIEKYIAFIEAKPEAKPANHGFAHLLTAFDRSDLMEKHGQRLLKLWESAEEPWKEEVAHALQACGLKNNLELRSAFSRTGKLEPVRMDAGFHIRGDALAFSHDGKLLAAARRTNFLLDYIYSTKADKTIGLWNTDTWSPRKSITDAGNLYALIFAPDANSLYAVGSKAQFGFMRFDCRSGKLERTWQGHEEAVDWASLSKDGSRMATASFKELRICVWDIAKGTILKSFEFPGGCWLAAFSPDGKTLIRQSDKYELSVESLNGAETRTIPFPVGDLFGCTFTPDGRYLVVSRREMDRHFDSRDRIELFSVADGYKRTGRKMVDSSDPLTLAPSPDGKSLVVGDAHRLVWVYQLPELKLTKQLISKKETFMISDYLAFSPNGRFLAVGSKNDRITLFRGDTFERILKKEGHTGNLLGIYFLADGKTLRSVASDNSICDWDASNMKLLKQRSLPGDLTIVSVHPNGRYALCPRSEDLEKPWERTAGERKVGPILPCKVFDLETGKRVSEIQLDVNWSFSRTHHYWLNDHEALIISDELWCHYDFLAGKALERRHDDNSTREMLNYFRGSVSEDGKRFWQITTGKGGGYLNVRSVDIATAAAKKLGQGDFGFNRCGWKGLVPGGKYFYVYGKSLHVFRRDKLKKVARRFFYQEPGQLVFSPDGERYATVERHALRLIPKDRDQDPKVRQMVRIYETLSGRNPVAFEIPDRPVKFMRFSPKGDRLALAYEDGVLEIWPTQ